MSTRRPRPRACWTKDCDAMLIGRERILCPSCRYIGARAFAVGSFVAGAIAWLLR